MLGGRQPGLGRSFDGGFRARWSFIWFCGDSVHDWCFISRASVVEDVWLLWDYRNA